MNSRRLHFWSFPILFAFILSLAGCARQPAPADLGSVRGADAATASVATGMMPAPPPTPARPGLGTGWGEDRDSRVTSVDFQRARPDDPLEVATIYYNDEQGAEIMAAEEGVPDRVKARFTSAQSNFEYGITGGGRRNFLKAYTGGNRKFVIGENSERYAIFLKNRTNARLEFVVSVDGLDVISGQPASFQSSGYVLDPAESITIDGWRRSTDKVAAFRFGSVAASYAALTQESSRNVGVIGIAAFHEAGSRAFRYSDDELEMRRRANPFPQQFASPPSR